VVNRAGSGCMFSLDLPRHGQRSPV
jgi:hypothetical protein